MLSRNGLKQTWFQNMSTVEQEKLQHDCEQKQTFQFI